MKRAEFEKNPLYVDSWFIRFRLHYNFRLRFVGVCERHRPDIDEYAASGRPKVDRKDIH